MGLWEFLQQWPRGRLVAGIVASVLLHVALVLATLWGVRLVPDSRWVTKKGDALIVELPKPEEPASPGSPKAAAPPPVASPRPPTRAATAPPREAPAPPREAPAPPRETQRVAAAPPRAAEPAPPAPQPVEPTPNVAPAPRAPEPGPAPSEPAPKAADTGPPAPAEPRRAPSEPQVAALPPGGGPNVKAAPDARSALARGGGGPGQGRGGIEGDPIALDSPDPRFREYFEQIRRRIQDKLIYPCVRDPGRFECEHKTTSVVVHFGILKSGQLQFVEAVRSSEWPIYDAYSVNAIKLAQPFPPVPPAIMAALTAGTTGVPIQGHFNFTVYTSLDSIVR